jgi:hypothetical protein
LAKTGQIVAPGLVLGVIGGALLARYAIGTFFGIKADPFDPIAYSGSIGLLLVSCAVALWAPSRKGRDTQVTMLFRG